MSREIAPGAPAAAGTIPLSVPDLGQAERDAVEACMASGWVSSAGPFIERFERQVAAVMGREHGVACSSGTAALHVALLLAGVEPGDEVVTSTFTFVAPANAIRYCAARPVFIDAEERYWQLDPAKLEAFLEEGCEQRDGVLRNRESGRRIAAVLPVHVLGHPCDAEAIGRVADRFGLPMVEDAAEALGTRLRDRPAGSAGVLAAMSFNGNKIATSGGGGMLVTDDAQLADRARYLTTQAKDDPVEYIHGEVGFNYRLTSLAAALGEAQVDRLDELVAAKRAIAARYAEELAGVPAVELMPEADWAFSTYWLYTIRTSAPGLSARAIVDALGERGVQARPVWQPMHRSPAHAGAQGWRCEVADRLAAECVSLPCSTGLSEADQQRVIAAVLEVLR